MRLNPLECSAECVSITLENIKKAILLGNGIQSRRDGNKYEIVRQVWQTGATRAKCKAV